MSSENTAAPQTPKPSSSGGTLDRYFNITERGSTISTEIRGGLATFFAMSYIVVLNPLILGLTPDSSGRSLGVPQVAAMTALVAGVMTILLGVYAKHPFAMAAGLGVNALLATTIATTPNLTWPQIMGLVVWAGVLMTALVLTGFRTAVFDAVPESLKTAIVVGIGLFIAFVGLVNAGIIRRAETGSTPVVFGVHGHLLGWPTLVFIVGLFLTIILYVRQVRGAILYGMLASTALSLILEAVAPAMVFVGFLMVRQAVNVDWNDLALGISAFLTIVIMPLSYSIAHGIGAGFISYTVIRVATGRGREVHWLMYVVSAVFAVHFGMGLIEGWMR